MAWHSDLLDPFTGTRSQSVENTLDSFRKFIHSAVIGSIALLICAIVALIWANSPWSHTYFDLWHTHATIGVGDWVLSLTLHEWVNEGLMMTFFLVIGLEVKEQILVGELSTVKKALLPVAAAFGGMIFPALIYTIISAGGAGSGGWGIPMATDIAFALGILSLLGKRIPLSLKVFLAALAIADDLGAIAVISLFYTQSIAIEGLVIALVFWLVIFILGRLSIFNAFIFFALSCGVWFGFSISGIHATLAGVLVAIAIPARSLVDPEHHIQRLLHKLEPHRLGGRILLHDKQQQEVVNTLHKTVQEINPPLVQLERSLHPWVTFVVMPLFALSNAGVVLSGDLGATLTSSVSLGVICGLVIGKPLGITLFTWLMVRAGLAELPRGLTMRHIQAVSLLAGIGFTVALFITELAFSDQPALADEGKIGILAASLIAGLLGYFILRRITAEPLPEAPVKPDRLNLTTASR